MNGVGEPEATENRSQVQADRIGVVDELVENRPRRRESIEPERSSSQMGAASKNCSQVSSERAQLAE
jgi:hypothetical protein